MKIRRRQPLEQRSLYLEQLENRWVLSSGMVDPSFGTNGRVRTQIGGFSFARDVALQADGKAVVVGFANDGVQKFAVARYNTNGSLDSSFGNGGIVTTRIENAIRNDAFGVAIQSDGKIVAAGESYNGVDYDIALARYHLDGSLDTSFDGDGIVVTDLGLREVGRALAMQSDGKIVVAGNDYGDGRSASSDVLLVRYNSNGSLDGSFDGDGIALLDVGAQDEATSMALRNDGKILVAGNRTFSVDQRQFFVARFNTTGVVDPSFGDNGSVVTHFGLGPYADDMTLQSDGKIVVVGLNGGQSNQIVAIARYTPQGELDTTFGDGDGKITSPLGFAFSGARGVVVQRDGKIVVAGTTSTTTEDFLVARFNSDGSVDTLFGDNGSAAVDFSGTHDRSNTVALQDDGRIVIAGVSASRFGVTRVSGSTRPSELRLSNASVLENQPSGTPVGIFSTVDDDPRDSFTYALVAGVGSRHNASFRIVGNELQTAVRFNREVRDSYWIRVRTTDSDDNVCEGVFAIAIGDVNDRPVIKNGGPDVVYQEDDPPLQLLADTTALIDFDSPDFDGGSLIVSTARVAGGNDRLVIRHDGTGAGQIGVSGDNVTFAETTIGVLSGGVGNDPLVVALNAQATASASQALLRAVTFHNVNTNNLLVATRIVEFKLDDGDGGVGVLRKTLRLEPANDAPQLGGISGSVGYAPNATSILLAGAATLADVDSPNFEGGRLVVDITSGADASNRLLLGGAFNFVGDNVVYNGTVTIGTRNASGGMGETRLEIDFNANAARTIMQQLLRAIRFRTVGGTSTVPRSVEFSITDGDGGASDRLTKTVNVT